MDSYVNIMLEISSRYPHMKVRELKYRKQILKRHRSTSGQSDEIFLNSNIETYTKYTMQYF